MDTVTAAANINTIRNVCFHCRSKLGDSLRSHGKSWNTVQRFFTQSFAAALVRSELVSLNAPALEPPDGVGAALTAVAFFGTFVHIWEKKRRRRWWEKDREVVKVKAKSYASFWVTFRSAFWNTLLIQTISNSANKPLNFTRLFHISAGFPSVEGEFLGFESTPNFQSFNKWVLCFQQG